MKYNSWTRQFSWEKPIEEEILEFVDFMLAQWQKVADKPKEWAIFGGNRLQENAKIMVEAYKTVQKHIKREIEFRKEFPSDCKTIVTTGEIEHAHKWKVVDLTLDGEVWTHQCKLKKSFRTCGFCHGSRSKCIDPADSCHISLK